VDWEFLEREFGAVYTDDPGRLPLPTRLMAGLAILSTVSIEPRNDAWLISVVAPSVISGLAAGKMLRSSSRNATTCAGVKIGS
jgi:hypothetical protein